MPIRTRYVNIQFVPKFSIAYSKGNCKYRVAFAGKYCRKLLYKQESPPALTVDFLVLCFKRRSEV